jgi:acetylornithine/N-succinyldiaminopimelate aminotransferase
VVFDNAFHGRTLLTMTMTDKVVYRKGFGPFAPEVYRAPAPYPFRGISSDDAIRGLELLFKTQVDPASVACVVLEPVQGEGGIRPVPKEFLQELRGLCDEYGLLLILDEVQSGVGRTGRLFAHEWSGVTPDIMAVAKGIGGGFPMGACLATGEAASGMVAGTHGSTYGGNPLAMAVGNAVLDVVLEEGFLEHVRDVALVFRQGLAALKDRFPEIIEDVRGDGLMLGIKSKIPVAELLAAVRAEKLLGVPAGDNVLRLLPPLTVTAEEAREGLARIERAAEKLTAAKAA